MTRLAAFWRDNRLTILVILVLAIAYLFLRTTPTEIASVEAFIATLSQQQPTVVHFYSNRCSACLLAKPTIDSLEREIGDDVHMAHINTGTREGQQIASLFGVRGIPTLVVFDGEGAIVHSQVGRIVKEPVLETLELLKD